MCRKKYPHLIPPKATDKTGATDKTNKTKLIGPKDKQVYRPKHNNTDGNAPNNQQTPVSILKQGDNNEKVQTILKEVGLVSVKNLQIWT